MVNTCFILIGQFSMNGKKLTYLFFFTLIILTFAAIKPKSKVKNLSISTFEEFSQDYKFLLVLFTSAKINCKPCEMIKPTFEVSVKELHNVEKSTDVLPATFHCDDNEKHVKHCQQFGVQQVPRIVLFRDGKPFRVYSGNDDPKILTSWIIKKTRPLIVELKDKTDIQQYILNSDKNKLIGYFRKGENGETEYSNFKNLVTQDVLWSYFSPIGIVRDEKIAEDEIGGAPGLQIYKPKNKKPVSIHQDELSTSRQFIIKNGYPLFSMLDDELYEVYTGSGLHTVIIHYKKPSDVQNDKLMFLEIAASKQNQMFFCYAPLNPQMVEKLENIGINTNNPVIINSNRANSNMPHRPIYFKGNSKNKEEILEWIDGILKENIKPNEKDEL
jgi:thiol-disulfide isomerase/thioredoxin